MKNPTPLQIAGAYEAQMDAMQDRIESEYERQADAFDEACSRMEEQIRNDRELVGEAVVESYDSKLNQDRYADLEFRLANARQDVELMLIAKEYKTLMDDAITRYAEIMVRKQGQRRW